MTASYNQFMFKKSPGSIFQSVNIALILCDTKRLVDMTVTTVDRLAVSECVFHWTLSESDAVDVNSMLHLEIIDYKNYEL